MRFVLTATASGIQGVPAYDGDIIGVYASQDDALAAHGLSPKDGRQVTIIPGRLDTFGDVWNARDGLRSADISVHVDAEQHKLIEAAGYEATVLAGDLTNAPTEQPLEG